MVNDKFQRTRFLFPVHRSRGVVPTALYVGLPRIWSFVAAGLRVRRRSARFACDKAQCTGTKVVGLIGKENQHPRRTTSDQLATCLHWTSRNYLVFRAERLL